MVLYLVFDLSGIYIGVRYEISVYRLFPLDSYPVVLILVVWHIFKNTYLFRTSTGF